MKKEGAKLMDAAILIPVGNAKIRDPETRTYLAEDGELKPLIGAEGRYWRRRMRDGSVMIKPLFAKKQVKIK
jgi:hypothetical protein